MKGKAIGVLLLLCIVFSWTTRGCAPGGSGVIAELEVPGIGEYQVEQEWQAWIEPYWVEFRYRSSGSEEWRYIVLDSQASRWFDCRLEFDSSNQEVLLWRGAELYKRFNVLSEIMHGPSGLGS